MNTVNTITSPSKMKVESFDMEAKEYLQQQLKLMSTTNMANEVNDVDINVDDAEVENKSQVGGLTIVIKILQAILFILIQVVKGIVMLFSVVTVKVLLAIGPLSLAFSVLPIFKDKVIYWLNGLLNLGFVFTSINILDLMFGTAFATIYAGKEISSADILSCFNVSFVLFFIYLRAFWVTKNFVGAGDASKVIGKGVAAASLIAGAITTASGIGGATMNTKITNAMSGIAKDSFKK